MQTWLDEFAAAVRERDYERGRAMFAPDAVGFGTVAARAVGLATLIDTQWRHVWSATRDFAFDLDNIEHGGADPIYWAAVRWSSIGSDADGRDVHRYGRATIVLHRRDGELLAVHSHYSFVPSGDVTPQPARPR